MSTSQKRDADMDRLLRAVLQPKPRGSAGACPDPELLAALVEGGLTANEQSALDAHVAGCSRCQEALAILSHDLPAQEEETVAPPESGWFTWATRPRLRWLVPVSAAATVAVVFFATRPLIAPEGEVPGTEVIRMAQAPSAPAGLPADSLDAGREKSAAPEMKGSAGAPELRETAKSLAAQPAPAEGAAAARADVRVPAAESARDRKPVEPATGMMAARVASEEKRAQPTATAALPAPAQMAAAAPPGEPAVVSPPAANVAVAEDAARRETAAGKGRGAGVAGAPAKLVRSLDTSAVTVSAPGGDVRWRLGTGGRLARSADAGASWQAQASGVTGDLLAGSAPSSDVCWIVGAAGTVLVTADGLRWERRPFPEPVQLVGVRASDARTATVTTVDGRRFDTLDGGLTWFPAR